MMNLLERYAVRDMWPAEWIDGNCPLLFLAKDYSFSSYPQTTNDAISIASDLPSVMAIVQLAQEALNRLEKISLDVKDGTRWCRKIIQWRSYQPLLPALYEYGWNNYLRLDTSSLFRYEMGIDASSVEAMKSIVTLGYLPVASRKTPIKKSDEYDALIRILYPIGKVSLSLEEKR